MTIYFTSDWHLFHKNIIQYSRRPFDNVTQMNNHILNEFRSRVKYSDTVYYLGDFAFGVRAHGREIEQILREITNSCTFYVVLGNHDHDRQVEYLLRKYCKKVDKMYDIKVEEQNITLCHYPMQSFHQSHRNAWQLYGHHHRDTNSQFVGKRYNVSVDANHFKFLSFAELKEIMDARADNWDFIPPERRDNQRLAIKYTDKIKAIDKRIARNENHMKTQFTDRTPEKVVQEAKMNLAILKKEKIELEGLLQESKETK